MPDDGPDLCQRFRDGDESAFRSLVDNHEAALRARLAKSVPASLQRRISVADVLQETWMVAFRRRADFAPEKGATFGPWVHGIAAKKLQEEVRRHGRTSKRAADREVTRGARPDTRHFEGGGQTPSVIAGSTEELERVRAAMEQLSEDHRRILILALDQGLPLGEAAIAMGRSREAAKKLYGRAMVRLRQVLGGPLESSPDEP